MISRNFYLQSNGPTNSTSHPSQQPTQYVITSTPGGQPGQGPQGQPTVNVSQAQQQVNVSSNNTAQNTNPSDVNMKKAFEALGLQQGKQIEIWKKISVKI